MRSNIHSCVFLSSIVFCFMLIISVFALSAKPADPFPEFSRFIATMDDPLADPYEQLEQLEKFYRQISENRLDHGLRAASLYLDKAYLLNDSTYIAKGYHLRGIAYSRAGDYLNALKDNLKSLEITEVKGDTIAMCNSYNNLGIIFDKLEKGEQALEYFEKSLKISRDINDQPGIASTLNNMGTLHSNLGNAEKAIKLLLEAQQIHITNKDSLAIAYNIGNIGNVFMESGDFRRAASYFNQSATLFRKYNDRHNLAYSFLNLGGAMKSQNRITEAIENFEKGLELSRSTHQAHLTSLLLKSMAEAYAALDLFDEAYQFELKHSHLRDSLLNQEALEQITFYQTLYEAETKEREISLLRKDQEVKALQLEQKNTSLQRSRMRATILMFSLVISILAAIMIVSRNRQKRIRILNAEKFNSQRDQISAIIKTQEEERIRFARDLHDGLGQMLTALKINLSHKVGVSGYQEEIPPVANSLIKEMHQEIRNISFNIMPQLLVQKGLIPALHELTRKLNSLEKLSISVFEYEVNHRFSPSTEIAIYRIVQELLNNIIKYSKATQVSIQLIQHKKVLNIHVEDDGIGFDTTRLKNSEGSGWKNICSRLKYIEGNIDIDSRPNRRNTTVIIDIPLK